MQLRPHGYNTSEVEILNISKHGFWLYVKGKEYFLSHEEYPWFQHARLSEILHVQLLNENHLYWEDLNVDISVESLNTPEYLPLIFQ